MAVDLTPATPADMPICARLLKAQLQEHHLPADDARIDRGIVRAFAPGSPAWLVLAWREGKAVGIALTNRNVSVERGGETLWIEELYVVPECRRSGVATAILFFLEKRAREEGMAGIDLEVVPSQTAALALYSTRGFKHLDRLRVAKTF